HVLSNIEDPLKHLFHVMFLLTVTSTADIYTRSLHDALPISRLTALATTRGECLDLLADLIGVMGARMLACRQLAVRDIWQLPDRSEEHTSELQSRENLVCRLLLEKKKLTFKP